eukprot:CAMPEP_0183729392 /NCGR_PEP_ID=MMETSP0737-20130205/30126_1 /TAXON_ID=385413 /ORGANISM="Thalassiosira miniscula, Strain CCMP1093" /LENGTH=1010 /DNA_ID=CAMNT_0025961555 /DNA_START=121 /DNA_END=3150 /DNA_ORIENTATION=+
MSSSDETLRNLEVECHYLSHALTKLKPNTPEWSFLHQKLEAAEEELDAVRRDQVTTSGDASAYPTMPSTPYRDNPDEHHSHSDIGWNRETEQAVYEDKLNKAYSDDHSSDDGGQRPLVFDDASYEPVLPMGSPPSSPVHHRRNRFKRKFMKVISPTGSTAAAAGGRQNTKLVRMVVVLSTLLVAVLLSIILIFTLGKREGEDTKSTETNNNELKEHVDPQLFTGPCASFSMHLIPDKFGNETSWKILSFDGVDMANIREAQETQEGVVVLEGGPYSYKKEFDSDAIGSHYEMVHATTCLPVGSYTFVLFDAKGDGICCDYGRGEYGINLSKGRVIRPLTPGSFNGKLEVTPFQVAEEDIDVLPPPTSTSSLPDNTMASNNDLSPEISLDTIGEAPNEPCASFSMHLIPDQFGNETTWKIRRYDGVEMSAVIESHKFQQGEVVLSGGPYLYRAQFDHDALGSHYEMIHATTCLPIGSYAFILYDAKGDGICCNYGRGEYGINLSKGRVIRPLSNGKFTGAGEVTPFEVKTEDIDVLPDLSQPTAVASPEVEDSDVAIDSPDAPPPTLSTNSDQEPCASWMLHLVPDQFGNETSWKVLQKVEGTPKEGGRMVNPNIANNPTFQPTSWEPTYFPTTRKDQRLLKKRSLRQFALKNSNFPRKIQQLPQQWKEVLSGGPYTYIGGFDKEDIGSHYNAIVARACFPIGSYKFILYDAKGDGICCFFGRGEYGINLLKGRVIRPLSSGEFLGVDEVTPFEITADDIDVNLESMSLEDTTIPNEDESSSSSSLSSASTESSFIAPTDGIPSPPENAVQDNAVPDGDVSEASTPVVIGRPATSIGSLTSLVTVSPDGTSEGRSKSYGILFDVESFDSSLPVVIAGMDLYLDSSTSTHYEIWTKSGSWQNVNTGNPDYKHGFRQISHGTIIGKGSSEFTKIPLGDFEDVELIVGERQAFWVTLSDNMLVFKNYEASGISRHEMGNFIQAGEYGKDEFQIFYGAAVRAYPLESADPVADFW